MPPEVSYEELAGIFQGALSTEEVRRAFSRPLRLTEVQV